MKLLLFWLLASGFLPRFPFYAFRNLHKPHRPNLAGVLDFWRHLETTGWDIACVSDHFMPNTREREGAVLESWSTLTALASLVPRMRVGTIVLGNTTGIPQFWRRWLRRLTSFQAVGCCSASERAGNRTNTKLTACRFTRCANAWSGWMRRAK